MCLMFEKIHANDNLVVWFVEDEMSEIIEVEAVSLQHSKFVEFVYVIHLKHFDVADLF